MTFAAARVSMGTIARRVLELGDVLPVSESFAHIAGGTPTITAPTGIVENDLLVWSLGFDGAGIGGTIFTPPADTTPWIELTIGACPNNQAYSGVWYKIVTAVAEPATYQMGISRADLSSHQMWRVSGADLTDPFVAFSTSRLNGIPSGNAATLLAINCTRTNCLLIHHLTTDNNFNLASITAPGGAEVVDHIEEHGTGGQWHAVAHEDFAVGGGTGDRVWTIQDNFPHLEERCTHLIGIQPPLGVAEFLELEGSTDHILFEDDSGSLKLE